MKVAGSHDRVAATVKDLPELGGSVSVGMLCASGKAFLAVAEAVYKSGVSIRICRKF